MKIIGELSEMIEDEIGDIEKYAKAALELKESHPDIADTFYKISIEEDHHREMLHTAVTNLIEQTKKEGKAVPYSMMDFYEYLHKRHVCEYEKALRFQQMYKK